MYSVSIQAFVILSTSQSLDSQPASLTADLTLVEQMLCVLLEGLQEVGPSIL